MLSEQTKKIILKKVKRQMRKYGPNEISFLKDVIIGYRETADFLESTMLNGGFR